MKRPPKPPRLRYMPPAIAALPRMKEPGPAFAYPIPWFVGDSPIDGKPDFRVIRPGGIRIAHASRSCWICGEAKGNVRTFVLGPMCMINRISSEPPSHLDCAKWAVRNCPFLANPRRKRRPLGEATASEVNGPPGIHSPDNPGGSILWSCHDWTFDGEFFRVGDPYKLDCYVAGKHASAEQIHAIFDAGLARLVASAALEGPAAFAALSIMVPAARALLPPRPAVAAWPDPDQVPATPAIDPSELAA